MTRDGHLVTVDPSDLKVTNCWKFYGQNPEVKGMAASVDEEDVLVLNVKSKDTKSKTIKISCSPRSQLLTDVYACEYSLATRKGW